MPIRPIASPNKLRSRIVNPRVEPMKQFAASTLSKGMNTSLDPADLPPEAFTLAVNSRMRFDKASRRPGSLIYTPARPDNNKVLHLNAFKMLDDSNYYIVRLTKNSVYTQTAGTWAVCTGTALVGGDTDRFTDAVVALPNNLAIPYVFANNGQNEIQKLNPATSIYADLRAAAGVSTKYRYITGFYNRVIGFALANASEARIGWSGDGNITVWDPSVDNTAGFGDLIDSPNDETDFIKGGVGFTSILIILRQRSIWHATKLPTPQNPFNFYAAIPGIGCDCPDSLRVTTLGLAWVDTRTATVWSYMPGQLPQPIGRPIEKSLINAINDPTQVFASYDARNFEYQVAIPGSSSTVLIYTYNFRNQSWVYDEQPNVSTIADGQFSLGGLSINQLQGQIQDLVGQIKDLGSGTSFYGKLYGQSSGDIWIENMGSNNDGETTQADGTGSIFTFNLTSKAFKNEHIDEYFARVMIEYQASSNTNLTLEYSRDGGLTWTTLKTVSVTTLNKPQLLTAKKVIKARRLNWRLTSTSGSFDVLGYEVDYFPGAESRVSP